MLLTKLNYFFEDELKHKEIWKNENSEIHILAPNTGEWHSLSGELQDCQCIKRLFHDSLHHILNMDQHLNHLAINYLAYLVLVLTQRLIMEKYALIAV